MRACAHPVVRLREVAVKMTRLSMSKEEKSWMILRCERVEKRRLKSTCSSRESIGLLKVNVSIPEPRACGECKGQRYIPQGATNNRV